MEVKNKIKGNRGLLYETLKHFVFCVSLCFVITLPLFYLLTKCYYAEDLLDLINAVKMGKGIPEFDLEQDIILGMMIQFVLIFLVISLSLYITIRFTTKKMFAPFDDTLQKVESFNLAKDEVPQFMPSHIKEFTRLNEALRQLVQKDKEIYRIQKEFTENASHELQTPLAIIRSKLDLLMQEEIPEHQMSIVSDLNDLALRMSRLNRNLLLLARIDHAQYSSMEEQDISALLLNAIPQYEVLRSDVKLLVLLDQSQQSNLVVMANPTLLDCLLKNLIVNAIRHSASDREIQLVVSDDSLTVINSSSEPGPLDSSKLFMRFGTVSMHHGANGLGLSIVKAICDFHHWQISYHYTDMQHHFIVNFK